MTPITALIHTKDDALRLGRCLETLYACDQIVIVDHGSHDGTLRVAREYGAQVTSQHAGFAPQQYLRAALLEQADAGWILSLDPHESLTESLAASLFEWKSESAAAGGLPWSVFLREETPQGWIDVPTPQTRLVPLHWSEWNGNIPVHDPAALALEGELLRFVFP